MPGEQTTEALLLQLDSEAPEQRLEALLAVQSHLPPELRLTQRVMEHVGHTHPGLRQAALEVLGSLCDRFPQLTPKGALKAVLSRRADANPRVRAEVAGALALVEDEVDSSERRRALLELLADEDVGVREQAAAAAGDLRLAEAVEPLAALLSEAEPGLAFEAAFALASLKDGRARLPLEAGLGAKQTRHDACEGLRRLGDPAAIPALQEALQGWFIDGIQRLSVRAALYALGEVAQAAPLIKMTRSWRIPERTHAFALIGSHGVLEAQDILQELVAAPKHRDRSLAMAALAQLPGGAAVLRAVAEDRGESLGSRLDAVDAIARAKRWTELPSVEAAAPAELAEAVAQARYQAR